MKTAGRRNPNRWDTAARTPSLWRGRSEQISLDQVGWEARKTPAAGEVFFLDFPLYRTSQDNTPSDFIQESGQPSIATGDFKHTLAHYIHEFVT